MIITKMLYSLLGLGATALGVIGIWVPGLPTTVFILIALWAFSHSSTRLYSWLSRIPILKTALSQAHRFQREGSVDMRAKIISQGSAWLSFVAVTLVFRSITTSIIVGLLAVSCSVFMYCVPSAEKISKPAIK